MSPIAEGNTINGRNFVDVPPGSILNDGRDRNSITVLDNGYAVRNDGQGVYPLFSLTGWRVATLGTLPVLTQNTETFLQRARTVCIGAANQNGVSVGPVRVALDRIGANEESPPLGIGMWLHSNDMELRRRLASAGAIFGHGDPNHWETYLQTRAGDPTHREMGGVVAVSHALRVLHLPNPETEKYLTPPDEAEVAEIARLRGQMWIVGERAKRANRWCGAFEIAVGTLGVNAQSVTVVSGVTPQQGRTMPIITTDDEAAEFPVGAVFEFASGSTHRPDYNDDNWNWTRRAADFRFSTRHYIGPNGGHWGGTRRVLWDGREDMRIPISLSLMAHLPVGTRVSNSTNDYHYYKNAPNRWGTRPNEGGSVVDSGFFGGAELSEDTESEMWFVSALPNLPAS